MMNFILRAYRTASLVAIAVIAPALAEHVETRKTQDAMTPAAALDRLKQGNRHFAAGKTTKHNWKYQRIHTAEGQYPYAAILSCMDSRTPPEIIFDQGLGDVFDARIAGNIVDDDVLGSLEYATAVAGAKLIAVVGHTGCGAVKGAVDDVRLGHVTGVVAKIKPVVDRVAGNAERTSKNHELVDRVAEENVHVVRRQLVEQSAVLRDLAAKGKIRIVGGMYDLHTGKVAFFHE